MAAKNKPNELYLTRVYDAPLKTVWEAFNDPEQAKHWWGPRGHTIKTHSKDLRVGGHWTYTMFGPEGQVWENKTVYHEVEKYSRLVYDHGGNDEQDRPPLFRVTATFTELAKNKTELSFIMAFEDEARAKEIAKFIKQASGNSTWDRFGEYLEKETTNKEIFIINRSFNTDMNTMYKMWTDPDHFSKWLAPTGFNMQFIRAEIKPGGKSFYKMSSPEFTMYGTLQYKEITPTKIVYSQQFADEKENISRHPGAPTWPESMLTTVMFTSEDTNQTRVTIQWEVEGKCTPEELQAFIKERGGMTQGWTGSFDKLEEYLQK